jgi:hypothetical protein
MGDPLVVKAVLLRRETVDRIEALREAPGGARASFAEAARVVIDKGLEVINPPPPQAPPEEAA